jgi:hypothetical protein
MGVAVCFLHLAGVHGRAGGHCHGVSGYGT